jgi:hypothetical protein
VAEVALLKAEPEGIGGWLVLPLIGLVLAPLSLLYSLFANLLPGFRGDLWLALTTPDSGFYSPYWPHYLVASSVLTVAFSVCAVVLLVAFLQRRRQVPLLMTLFYLAAIAMGVFDLLSLRYFAGHVPLAQTTLAQGGLSQLVRSAVPSLIWIPYFHRSVRVRNTFTR